jgi:hypothetical protein
MQTGIIEYNLGGGYWAIFEGNGIIPKIVYRSEKTKKQRG